MAESSSPRKDVVSLLSVGTELSNTDPPSVSGDDRSSRSSFLSLLLAFRHAHSKERNVLACSGRAERRAFSRAGDDWGRGGDDGMYFHRSVVARDVQGRLRTLGVLGVKGVLGTVVQVWVGRSDSSAILSRETARRSWIFEVAL